MQKGDTNYHIVQIRQEILLESNLEYFTLPLTVIKSQVYIFLSFSGKAEGILKSIK